MRVTKAEFRFNWLNVTILGLAGCVLTVGIVLSVMRDATGESWTARGASVLLQLVVPLCGIAVAGGFALNLRRDHKKFDWTLLRLNWASTSIVAIGSALLLGGVVLSAISNGNQPLANAGAAMLSLVLPSAAIAIGAGFGVNASARNRHGDSK